MTRRRFHASRPAPLSRSGAVEESTDFETAPATRDRLLVAAMVGLVAFAFTFVRASHAPMRSASDFDIHWIAARAVLAGGDPYVAVPAAGWEWPYYYPVTASLVSMLVSWLPRVAARAAFVGLSSGVLAYASTQRRWWGLLILLTPSFLHGYYHAQWTPLLTGALLLPILGGLFVVKPSIGLAYFVSRPSWYAVVGGALLLAITLLMRPSWPAEWLRIIGGGEHIIAPVIRPGGLLLLLAGVYWRRADARLLLALACVPHVTLLYETLPLFTVARTFRQMASLVILSVAGAALILYFVPLGTTDTVRLAHQWPFLLGFFYLPALTIVLTNGWRARSVKQTSIRELGP